MKILSINKFYWRKGGSEAVFLNEKALLESNQHQVIPFSMKSDKNEPSKYEEFFVDEIDYDEPGIKAKIKAHRAFSYFSTPNIPFGFWAAEKEKRPYCINPA